MNFTTRIPISISNNPIDYTSKIVSLGSCFADNIGAKFEYFKFQNSVNPFGIIFNPISIESLINRAVNKIEFTENDIFFHNEMWHCYEVHSDLSSDNKEVFLSNLNQILKEMFQQLTCTTHIIITYGTSWIYKLKSSGVVVANCHKVPQIQFDKEILSVEVIGKSIQNTLNVIQKANPNCNVIFTISPVRHLKDGFLENQRSNAHLIAALHNVLKVSLSGTAGAYFPSFEIMMDELRDYRFYTEDMLHPNQVAIDYIWERFCESAIAEEANPIMQDVLDIQKSLAHRPFNPNSEKHLKFLVNLNTKISTLTKKFPQIQF
jgi:hypothetical protein